MLYFGNMLSVHRLDDDIAELRFDAQDEKVNKLTLDSLIELQSAINIIQEFDDLKGLVITSAKNKSFIVGADIVEFGAYLAQAPVETTQSIIEQAHYVFNQLEDLNIPKVVAINGVALGGGFELCLACDYRVIERSAKVGLPEVKLGIFPGYGGTVRLTRLIGLDNALEWILKARQYQADEAFQVGAVDVVIDESVHHFPLNDDAMDGVKFAALDVLKKAIAGELDWRKKRQEKLEAIKLNQIEQFMSLSGAKAALFSKVNPIQYPAPRLALDSLAISVNQSRDEAIQTEMKFFMEVAKTPQSQALIGLFLNDQLIKRQVRSYVKQAQEVGSVAVLGAGIMGGGIAYQAVSHGLKTVVTDIDSSSLDASVREVERLLHKQMERQSITPAQMVKTLNEVQFTLDDRAVATTDVVIEAVTEKVDVKQNVLASVESSVSEGTILASNTSTISITHLARTLVRPENFVGMHFFNPVSKMPLVEVIRGEKTSDQAVATVVALAQKMGKTPIVVQDCAGFLVNRVLFPYIQAFECLLKEGADFVQVDQVMEQFGWPMGPAYLMDVIGLDTAMHVRQVMEQAYPTRMTLPFSGAIEALYHQQRFGQKNQVGFYRYHLDKASQPVKQLDDDVYDVLQPALDVDICTLTTQEIIDRMMIPLCNEAVRCLEEGIVGTPQEVDMAMILGLGFPAFRGGACRYIDQIGVAEYVALCKRYEHLGEAYQVPQRLKEMANQQSQFFS